MSCAEQISIDEIDAEQEFVFRCEIQPGQEPIATLQLTSLLDGSEVGGHLGNADIFLRDGTDSKNRLVYNSKTRNYIGEFVDIDPRKDYFITVSHEEYPDLIAESSTSIPKQVKFDSLQASLIQSKNGVERINTRAHLPKEGAKNAFFHIIPKRRKAIWMDGELKYLGIENMSIDRIHNDNFVVQELYHRPGVMVDGSRLEDAFIDLDLKTLPSQDGIISSAIFFEIISVTQDYYYFHIARSNQLRDANDLNSTPAINYTNMDNGFGLFTGKISRQDSVTVIR